MTSRSAALRPLIRQLLSEQVPKSDPETGPEVKGTPVAQAAEKRLDAFPSINSVLKNIGTVTDLRALIQNILDKVGESGKIDQREMMSALTKTVAASRKAASEKRKREREEKRQAKELEKAEEEPEREQTTSTREP